MNWLIEIVATGLYSGKLPKAPGTWGSLFAFIPWFFMRDLPPATYLLVVILTFIVGFLTAGTAEKLFNMPDAGQIVIDEIVGMFIALFMAPNNPIAWLLGFVYFRIFDIVKPFPVSWFDQRIHGGIGIMMDDVIAGIYALICLQLTWMLAGFFLFQ